MKYTYVQIQQNELINTNTACTPRNRWMGSEQTEWERNRTGPKGTPGKINA